jgi:hypothetical protein
MTKIDFNLSVALAPLLLAMLVVFVLMVAKSWRK